MAGALQRRTRLAICPESTFSTDPDSSGATYLWVPAMGDALPLQDQMAVLETDYFLGRNNRSAAERGNDLGVVNLETPLISFPWALSLIGITDDWLDYMMNAAFGTYAGVVTSTSITAVTASTISPSLNNYGIQDLLAVQDNNVLGGAIQWRRTASASAPYSLHRNFDSTPSTSSGIWGTHRWGPLSDPGGATLSAYFDQDSNNSGQKYLLTGGRPTSVKLMCAAGQMAKLQWGIRFDTITPGATKASLPAAVSWTHSPIKGQLWSIEWGGTTYHAKSVEIDFGLQSSDSESVQGTNGRSNIENLRALPIITFTPVFATGWETDFRAGTQRNLLIRVGFGNGRIGTVSNRCWCFWAEQAEVIGHEVQNDSNRLRQQIKIAVRDPGIFTGTTAGRSWQFARA